MAPTSVFYESDGCLSDSSSNHKLPGEDAFAEIKKSAERETKGARRWKCLVLLSILTTGALISAGTHHFLRQEQEDDYSQSVSMMTGCIVEFVYTRTLSFSFSPYYNTLSSIGNLPIPSKIPWLPTPTMSFYP